MSPSAPPPPTVIDRAPSSPGSSSGTSTWKGALVGAAVGLAFVGAVVVGSRYAYSASQRGTAAAASPVGDNGAAATPVQGAQATAHVPPVEPAPPPPRTDTPSLMPVVSASDLPRARPASRAPSKAHVPGAAPAGDEAVAATATGSPATSASAATTAAPAASAAPAPEDSAASLVPVIPSAAPPPADPFVKAVQDDIEGK